MKSYQNINRNHPVSRFTTDLLSSSSDSIISPFDSSRTDKPQIDQGDTLSLTSKNVETVLDEMRPYLKSDGGNVRLAEIDGPVVKLELQGACGSCPSSAMTMKMGLERRLKERIPEISEVIQTVPDAPPLTVEGVEKILDGVRPFLAIAGGKIGVVSLEGVGGLQPVITLKMEGTAAALQSVKLEIVQRIQKYFLTSLKIEWK
eukprot:gene11518-12560_t